MAFEVVDAEQGFSSREGEPLGNVDADEQGARQAWAVGNGDGVQVSPIDVGDLERFLERGQDRSQVRSRRLLGHHPAVPRVEISLRRDDVGLDETAVANHRHGRLVAAGFDTENACHNNGGMSKTRTPDATRPYSRRPSGLD